MTNVTANWNDKLVFFVGVNTGFVSKGQPDARFLKFYSDRSSDQLHCAIVGNVVVPNGFESNRSTPFLKSNLKWKELARTIQDCGPLPGIQLATAWKGYEGKQSFLSTDGSKVIEDARCLVRDLGITGIEQTLASFKAGAVLAVDQGFRHVQIHAAHGYLLSLLIDERINRRAYHVHAALADLAEWLRSQSVESSLRISMRTGDKQFDANGTCQFLDKMAGLAFDFVDLSSGFYNVDKRLIYPSLPMIIASRHTESIEVANRHPGQKFIFSGRISQAASALPKNAHVGLCRDLIANPNFLFERDNGCRNHNKCHYFSRGKEHITCPRWIENAG